MKINKEKVKNVVKVTGKVIGWVAGAAILGGMVLLADAYELPNRFKARLKKIHSGSGKHVVE